MYSHHHIDHVFGTARFEAEATERGWAAADGVRPRGDARTNFRRYERTHGWNTAINQRQFGLPVDGSGVPERFRYPDVTYHERLDVPPRAT